MIEFIIFFDILITNNRKAVNQMDEEKHVRKREGTRKELLSARFFSWDHYAELHMAAVGKDICVMRCLPNEVNADLHYHDFFTFIFVQNPAVRMKIDHAWMDDLAGKVVLFQPHTLHAIGGEGDPDRPEYMILVREELIRKKFLYMLVDIPLLSEFFLNGVISNEGKHMILDTSADPEIFRMLRAIHEEDHSVHDSMSQQILEAQFLILLMRLCRILQKQEMRNEKLSAEKILSYISAHAQDVTLQSLAEHFSYHPNYIAQVLRKETGSSFTGIKHYFQVKDACNMLRITSYPVQTIAMMVGFENQQYFYRLFKKFMGITPQEYRRQGASFGQ